MEASTEAGSSKIAAAANNAERKNEIGFFLIGLLRNPVGECGNRLRLDIENMAESVSLCAQVGQVSGSGFDLCRNALNDRDPMRFDLFLFVRIVSD